MNALLPSQLPSLADSQLDNIGKTPLVALRRYATEGVVLAKLEGFNPLYCVKCRTAWGMVRYAERQGFISKGGLIVEATSGNTGVGLSWVARLRGYRVTIVMPETMSIERRRVMAFLGAELVLTPGGEGMKGAIAKATDIAQEYKGYYCDQFSSLGNVEIHFDTTGPEIWEQASRNVDFAVFGVGTGGTLTGAGRYLKMKNPALKIIAVEPSLSTMLAGGTHAPHKIQGIAPGFIAPILDRSLIDGIEHVTNEEAIETARELARTEGVFVGISSGAAACAARRIASSHPDKTVVVVLPDTAERYLSTDLFSGI